MKLPKKAEKRRHYRGFSGLSCHVRRAVAAVEQFNRESRRQRMIQTEILPREDGDFTVAMGLDGNLEV